MHSILCDFSPPLSFFVKTEAATIRMEFNPHATTRPFDASLDQTRVHLIFIDTAPVE
jgi:hypothetical protein